ncbi:MAG: hypothetical protein GF310_12235 [candidate division Zixibacteria bacterium]|nr:hypothetical protein [candidate division Zixibacteria bacterium]
MRTSAIFIFLFMLLFISCNSESAESVWIDNSITIDGINGDWSEIPVNFYEDEELGFAISNDSDNLYLLLRFTNPEWARTIRMQSIILWIDHDGGKDKVFGLKYNGGPDMDKIKADLPESVRKRLEDLPPQQKERLEGMMEARPVSLEVVDNKAEQVVPIDQSGSDGIEVKYGFTDGFHIYEAKVPLEIYSDKFYGIKLDPENQFDIGAQWGGMPDREEMRERMAAMGGRSGGMRGGGHGMRPGGIRGGGFEPPEEKELWIRTRLASEKSFRNGE